MSLISENRRLVVIIAIFITMALSVIILSHYGNKALLGTKGYIIGERHWSVAQKQSVVSLIQFAMYGDERFYEEFNEHLEVIMGDRQARQILSSETPDYQVAYEGFLLGNLNEDEIDSMIWLFENFSHITFMQKAIEIWKEADEKIDEIRILAADLKNGFDQSQRLDEGNNRIIQELFLLDEELTILERNFSETIRQASVRIENLILYSMISLMGLLITVGGYITVKYFRETEELNKQLSEAESKFRNVLENSQDIIYQMDPEGINFEYTSPSVEQITGYSTEEVMEGGGEFLISKIHPEDIENYDEKWERFYTGDLDKLDEEGSEFRIKTKWGHYIWVNNKRSMVKDENGKPVEVVGIVRDISAQKKYMERLNKSIKEKEILMAEIHHRVKNNLFIVSGLIEMQKNEPADSVRETLTELQMRMMSIAMVHEKLYNSESFDDVIMSNYIKELTGYIANAYKTKNQNISVKLDLDPLNMKAKDAVPMGLIYNEMINNVYKHAFKDRVSGLIKVILKNRQNKIDLKVIDNGIGLPEDFSVEKNKSLGMSIIKELTKQLNGKLNVQSNSVTEFYVSLKK